MGSETPAARFGHTFTAVSKTKAVMFGGAIGDSGKFIITNDTYLFDFESKNWRKLDCTGDIPSQRAAHASCQLDNMTMFIYGGAASGGGGLSNDELYLLDLKSYEGKPNSASNYSQQGTAHYTKLPTTGPTPGKRYGHSMLYQKPFLIVFGGNTGSVSVNDVWVLNIDKSPFQWQRQCLNSQDSPVARVYHSAALCTTGSANGMMVVFGGRTQDQSALNDAWGMRRHRNGTWDWVLAPYKQNALVLPIARYQHRTEFIGSLLMIVGGRTSGSDDLGKCVEIYDTETSEWYRMSSFNRYRHTTVVVDQQLFVHGGFEPEYPSKPIDSMLQLDLSSIPLYFPKLSKNFAVNSSQQQLQQQQQQRVQQQTQQSNILGDSNVNNDKQPSVGNQVFKDSNDLKKQPFIASTNASNSNHNNSLIVKQQQTNQQSNPNLDISMSGMTMMPKMLNQVKLQPQQRSYTPIRTHKDQKDIKISNHVIVSTTQDAENIAQQEYYNQSQNNSYQQPHFGGMFKRVNIFDLQEESRKLVQTNYNDMSMMMVHPADQNMMSLVEMFINNLMKRPEEWKQNDLRLPFKKEFILRLCDEVTSVLLSQPSLLRLRVPLKIFGNIHGRFIDLLRFFSNFGYPIDEEGGDIEKFDYLFLGNYVDRGFNSLETVILLFALKIKFPDQVHLIRGAHEERRMNKLFGFAEECAVRLNEDINDPNSVYQRVNKAFDSLPLGSLVEEKIFCVHGGLGPNVNHVNEIVDIKRPISAFQNPVVYDLLYSDYAEHDQSMVAVNNSKDYFSTGSTYRFSDAKVEHFLEETGLAMIIRSKECVADGFQRSKSGSVTTLTSCTDYMGKYGNQAAIIKIKKNYQVEPNILQKTAYRNGNWIGNDSVIKSNVYFTEEEQMIRRRQVSPLQKLY